MENEKCVRCGDPGPDLRTLWMACLYAMDELGLPFEQCAISGQYQAQNGTKTILGRHEVPVFGDPTGEMVSRPFFTLRVCKDCRSDWMGAIKTWFETKRPNESCGSGIFVRENGANVEITEEEWRLKNPGREPVRRKRQASRVSEKGDKNG